MFFINVPCVFNNVRFLLPTNALFIRHKNIKIYIKILYSRSYIFRSPMTVIRSFSLNSVKVTLFVEIISKITSSWLIQYCCSMCHLWRALCVLCSVQSHTELTECKHVETQNTHSNSSTPPKYHNSFWTVWLFIVNWTNRMWQGRKLIIKQQ